jgi:hypothetical protein
MSDLYSMDSDGFTLVVTDQWASARRVQYLAIGGGVVQESYIGYKTVTTFEDPIDVTSPGFQPNLVFYHATQMIETTNAYYSTGIGNFSFGVSTSTVQHVLSMASYLSNPSSTNSYCNDGGDVVSVIYDSPGTDCYPRYTFDSFLSTGFRLIRTDGGGQYHGFHYVALKLSAGIKIGAFNTRTDSNNIDISMAFEPKAIIFQSVNHALDTVNVPSPNDRYSLGVALSTSNRWAMAFTSDDNVAPRTSNSVYDDAVYNYLSNDAVVGAMDITSISATGFTCVMDTADPSASWVSYIAFGDSIESGSQGAYVAGSGYTRVPDSDITTNGWVNEIDSTPIYPSLASSGESTYAWYETVSSGQYFEVGLDNPTGTPDGAHILAWKGQRIAGTQITTIKCELRQGSSTIIASDIQTIEGSGVQDFALQLDSGEISSITDYNDLRIRVTILSIT